MVVSLVQPVPTLATGHIREVPRSPMAAATAGEGEHRAARATAALRLAEAVAPRLHGPARTSALARLAAEADELRAALRWSLASRDPQQGALGLRLAAALWWFWFHRGDWGEGRSWLDRALAVAIDADNPTDDLAAARASARCGAGWLAAAQGDRTTGRRLLEASAALHRRRRDGRGLALAAGLLSQVLLAEDEPADARRLAGEAVALARTAGGDWDLALARMHLGNVERARGNATAAGRLYEESVAAARAAGDLWLEAMGLRNLGIVAARTGKRGRGIALLRESLSLSRDSGERWFVRRGLEELAGLTALDGDPARAARLLGAAEGVRSTVGAPAIPDPGDRSHDAVALVRAALPAATLARCWREGRALSPQGAIALALGEPTPHPALVGPTGEAAPASGVRAGNDRSPRVLVVAGGRARERTPRPPALRIGAFGPGRVEVGDRVVTAADWAYAKPRELLYYLLDHPDRTKEQVGLALWPEATGEQLRGSFHVALHHLRRVLGDPGWVRYLNRRYAVNRERTIRYDVAAFEDGLAEAGRADGNPVAAIAALEGAVACYDGDYLVAHGGVWIERRREGLRRTFADAVLRLGELRLEVRQPAEAAAAFRRLLAADGHHEAAHRGLIRALARQGEPAQALRHYEAMAGLLAAERAVRPASETAALVDRLRNGGTI